MKLFSLFALPVLLAASFSLSAAAHAADPPATAPTAPAAPAAPAVTPPVAVPPGVPVAPKATVRLRPALLTAGTSAPDISAIDTLGSTIKLSDFKGKIVVLDFWASWCPPCKASMPHNQEVIKKLQDAKVPVVLLAVDNSEAQPAFAAWVKAHPEYDALRFVYADPKTRKVSSLDYNVSGIPTQYVIDAQGVVRASFLGYGGPNDNLEKAVHAAAEPLPTK